MSALSGGCEAPFEPFREGTGGPSSLLGYLDVVADTQWIRVTPVHQHLLGDAAPIDAVVTLENLESGRTVTLRDSVFEFRGGGVEGIAYAHNFWTTERLERGVAYELKATRSDGAASTALVEMPERAEPSRAAPVAPPGLR